MRKQYYFRQSASGLLAWDVDRLVELTRDFPRKSVFLTAVRELDQPWSGDDEQQTWRAMLAHIQLMDEADLAYPIILAADGAVMDGMHRVAKAVRLGHDTIEAVQFDVDPPADHLGKAPEDLPY